VHPRLVGALGLHCGDWDVAEEMAQEALARVWERWDTVQGMDSPEAWAYRVAFNLVASRFRRQGVERRVHDRLRARPGPLPEPEPADRLAVRAAVASLPDRQRAVLVLRYYADLPVAAVAATLGCAEGTVKSLTSKAINGLRVRLSEVVLDGLVEHA
jgi:RNA polymerase sigma-70 factor (sigma-E family)